MFIRKIKQIVKYAILGSMVQIEPTRLCNFNCAHCNHKNSGGWLHLSKYREILDRHPNARIIKLQGLGEPLLHPEIQLLIDIAKERGHKVMIITNGSCDYVSNVDNYVFSLETMSPELFVSLGKKDLPNILENIRSAATKQKITINCVQCYLTTPKDVAEVKKFAIEVGADIWITPQEVWVDPSHQDYTEQLSLAKLAWNIHGIPTDYLKYRVCNWGFSEFYYDVVGKPHPCCIRMTDEYKNITPSLEVCKKCPL